MKRINLGYDLNHIVDLDMLSDDSVIVDAGANVGEFVKKIRHCCNAMVYAIEPSARNCKIIRDRKFDNIEIIEQALGSSARKDVTFTEYSGELKGDGCHRYHQWSNTIGKHKDVFVNDPTVKIMEYKVPTVSLKALISKYGWTSIDYLKMDVEGAEYEIFDDLEYSDAKIIRQISVEVHDDEKNQALLGKLQILGFNTQVIPGNEIYAWRK
jgi:FkbM family methyltransferase